MRKKILFINALKEITRKNAESFLEKSHITKIASTFHEVKNTENFSRVVDWQEIESYNYDLTIQKYVFIKDDEDQLTGSFNSYFEDWDSQSTIVNKEMSNLLNLLS